MSIVEPIIKKKSPLIYCWIGKRIPNWGLESIKYSSRNNPKRKIILLIDQNSKDILRINQNFVDIFLLDKNFLKKTNFKGDVNLSNLFWLNTAKRLNIIYLFCKDNKIEKFFHAELDNLVFELNDLEDKLKEIGTGLFCPRITFDRVLASLIFCNNIDCFLEVFKFFNPPYLAPTEMDALGFFAKNNKNYFGLPTESFHEYSDRWKTIDPVKTGGIFDANAMGQYLFGIDPIHEPFKPLFNMHININMQLNIENVQFFIRNKSLYIYYKTEKKKFKIYNLHIHSKQINLAKSAIEGKNNLLYNLSRNKKTLIKNRHKYFTGKILKIYYFIKNLIFKISRNFRNIL